MIVLTKVRTTRPQLFVIRRDFRQIASDRLGHNECSGAEMDLQQFSTLFFAAALDGGGTVVDRPFKQHEVGGLNQLLLTARDATQVPCGPNDIRNSIFTSGGSGAEQMITPVAVDVHNIAIACCLADNAFEF